MPVTQGTQSAAVASELESVFARDPGLPELMSCVGSHDAYEIALNVPADLLWFPGHFPNTPVLPGIVQLHWAATAAACLYGFEGKPRNVSRLKFKNVVIPPHQLTLQLKAAKAEEIHFIFTSEQQQHSLGTLSFAVADSC